VAELDSAEVLLPQFWQNFAPSEFLKPHSVQNIITQTHRVKLLALPPRLPEKTLKMTCCV
jgi:hypothetical protein